jgi:hypothetical protein
MQSLSNNTYLYNFDLLHFPTCFITLRQLSGDSTPGVRWVGVQANGQVSELGEVQVSGQVETDPRSAEPAEKVAQLPPMWGTY